MNGNMKWGIFMHVYIIYAWFRVVRGKIYYQKNSGHYNFMIFIERELHNKGGLLPKFLFICQLILPKIGHEFIFLTYILKLAHSIRYSSNYVHSIYVYYSGFFKIYLDIINQYVMHFT